MRLSQKDLAEFLGVSRAAVSQATKRGHKCEGYPVRAWAKVDASGRVTGYEVPDRVVKRGHQPEGNMSSEEPDQAALTEREPKLSSILGGQSFVPEVDSSTRVSLLPEGEDYARTASAGGTAYVVGKAIEEDNATAHGAVMVAGGGVGALIGGMAADHDDAASTALGALVGGLLGVTAGYAGIRVGENLPKGRIEGRRSERGMSGRRSGELERARTNGQQRRSHTH
jgi:hypothetical protein